MAVTIRPAHLPGDKPALLSFIDGSQRYEHAIEPDRRLDDTVADEHFALLSERLAARGGAMFVAEQGGPPGGWAVVHPDQNDVYVLAEERSFAYIAELFVEESLRGTGVGRALIAACEDWARAAGFKVMMIGVLAGNTRADAIYRREGYRPYALQLRKKLDGRDCLTD